MKKTENEICHLIEKILDDNNDKIENVRRVSTDEMGELMRPWISGSNRVLEKYLPKGNLLPI